MSPESPIVMVCEKANAASAPEAQKAIMFRSDVVIFRFEKCMVCPRDKFRRTE
jgi:hypothetical protein